jgi:probable O-glycosylation ligase (exosortase A-associated)
MLLFVVVFGGLPFMLRSPTVGIYYWAWLSYMNPHRLCWGAAYNFPFAQVVAITVFASMAANTKKLFPPLWNSLTITWLMFVIWMMITTLFAINDHVAPDLLDKVLKVQLIVFLIMFILRSRKEIDTLVWVTFLSIAYFGVKGGIFVIRNGGTGTVWGPSQSFIAGNNELAVAMLMCMPLGLYLAKVTGNAWIRRALYVSLPLILAAVVGSNSRGALLAIGSVLGFAWLKGNNKLLWLAPGILVIPLMFMFMPESWSSRMATIQTYEEDASAMGRLNAWVYSINLANDRFTGGGFYNWSGKTFRIWAPDPTDVHAAHSIYFGVLGDHGWVGLALFLTILLLSWRTANRILKATAGNPEQMWAGDLAKMIKLSMVAYMSGGAFLSLAYFDLPYQLMMMLVLLENLTKQESPAEQLSERADVPRAFASQHHYS